MVAGVVMGVLALAGGTAVALVAGGGDDTPTPEVELKLSEDNPAELTPLVGPDVTGKPAPSARFERLDGGLASLDDYKGRLLVVNFFGSWCVPCKEEMPDLQAVHRELGDKVAFLGLAVRDSAKDAKAFALEHGATYDMGRDPSGGILEKFAGVRMPSTFLVSPDGTVLASHGGRITADQLRELISEHVQ
jgi:cytochrome c biogenesis protein CcmG/thiol:disulfide interchange protein DsbE